MESHSKILVVDDSESIREVVSSELMEYGYQTDQAVNGMEGLEFLKEKSDYRLIITDLNMPHLDGISFLKEVRKIKKYKYLPILVLTTESQEERKMEAKRAGATGWVIKPFDSRRLMSIIQRLIN